MSPELQQPLASLRNPDFSSGLPCDFQRVTLTPLGWSCVGSNPEQRWNLTASEVSKGVGTVRGRE